MRAAGIALIVLLAAGWLTALPYLLVRLGLPDPVPVANIDGPHAFLGLAAAGLLAVKIVDLARRQVSVASWRMSPWQRWLSRSLAYLYGAVVLTGLLLALPWPATFRTDLVNLHLLSAAWALLATLPHLVIHLRGRLGALRPDRRLIGGLLLVLLPALALTAVPVALSPLAELGSGGSWQPVGKAGGWMFRLLRLNDGRLLAAGAGVWVSADQGRTWSVAPTGPTLVFAVATLPGGGLLLGTSDGLLRSPGPDGPYTPVAVPSVPVTAVYVDPGTAGRILIGGHGIWASSDAGGHWSQDVNGLVAQGTVWSIGRHGGVLMAGMTTGVYESTPAGWRRTLALNQVISLDDGAGGLWASSMGGGLAEREAGSWRISDVGMASHGSSLVHVTSFTDLSSGHALATMMRGGVDESLDGGRSWFQLSPGFAPGPVWAALPLGSRILVATDSGLFLYNPPPPAPVPSALWWLIVLLGSVGTVLAAAMLTMRELPRPATIPPPAIPAPRLAQHRPVISTATSAQ